MKKIKLLIIFIIIVALAWFIIINPMITFKGYENKMIKAAKRYYELNSRELPAGERTKSLKLIDLYDNGLIDGDMFIPYTTKTCKTTDSWVKVRKENNEYKYYVYLKCGPLESKTDHEGPVIELNGKEEITIGKGEKFTDPGVKSVKDKQDGNIKVENVTIKGKADTSKIGTYEIQYIVSDSLSNKTTVTRKVNVIQELKSTIKSILGEEKNFKGNPDNNYVLFSNMLFRIYGIDNSNNIVIVSDSDIANVNYTKLDEWLDYFYDNLNDNAKKMIVKNKYCNMTVDENSVSNTTKCTSYTKERKVYIPSIIEVNKAKTSTGDFMKPTTISWVSNKKDDKEAYVTRNVFFYEESGKDFITSNVKYNYGVRPMITIKGSANILSGSGTAADPYTFGDTKKAKGGDKVNTREVGEYITDGSNIWRIVNVESDGTTKVVSEGTIGGYEENIACFPDPETKVITYDPTNKASVAYFINNKATKYVDTSIFTNHKIKVPIYKDDIIYNEEIETKEYKTILSAPNMYDMFSAASDTSNSYWLINTSKKAEIGAAITEIGVPYNETIPQYTKLYVRVVGYLKSDTIISSGKGTIIKPYKIR